jgi:prepilin-type N-terminal cleavage/methylation domain-containing protein
MTRPRRTAGFTIIEVLVAVTIVLVIALLGVPPLLRMAYRAKIEGAVQSTAGLMRIARFEAIKRNVPARVIVDYERDLVTAVALEDYDGDGTPTPRRLGQHRLPKDVFFWGEEDAAPEGDNAISNFPHDEDGGFAEFRSDGSAASVGAIRFGDQRGNFLEVRVATAATGRIELRKWRPADDQYHALGEWSQSWEWY